MLTVVAVKNAGPKNKDYKLADSGGLYLLVTARGYRSWRFNYRFGGKERHLVFGSFPELSLAQARDRRDEAPRQLGEGKDPSLIQKRLRLVRSTRRALRSRPLPGPGTRMRRRAGGRCMRRT